MKDLTLTDVNGAVVAKFRAEMLSNTPANISIVEIRGADGVQVDNLPLAGTVWRKLAYSWAAIVAFCTDNNFKIFAADSNGSNGAILLGNQVPEGTQYPIVSADAGDKTILIATNVTADFVADDVLKIYNSDNTLYATVTHASDSYSAPNTILVIVEDLPADIPVSSGKYIINEGS